jgi:hypothetical protein
MLNSLKLPFRFATDRLNEDLARIQSSDWVPHFNMQEFEGDWCVAALRSVDGEEKQIYPDPAAGTERFADTPLLAACPYFQEVIAAFHCPKQSVRLLRLGAGSRIKEHRDHCLGFDDNQLRIHIPVATSPEVEFYVSGERIVMREGEAWYISFNLPHRIYNGGVTDRIHLVIDCEVNDWVRSVFYAQSFEQFRAKVLDDAALQREFRDVPDREELIPLLIERGLQHGFTFRELEVEAAMDMARQEWMAGSARL